jgi:hypothetical protein
MAGATEMQIDLFADPNTRPRLPWFPGTMRPADGQLILEVYEMPDGAPSEIIFKTYYQKFEHLERPIMWWTPMPEHPITGH